MWKSTHFLQQKQPRQQQRKRQQRKTGSRKRWSSSSSYPWSSSPSWSSAGRTPCSSARRTRIAPLQFSATFRPLSATRWLRQSSGTCPRVNCRVFPLSTTSRWLLPRWLRIKALLVFIFNLIYFGIFNFSFLLSEVSLLKVLTLYNY